MTCVTKAALMRHHTIAQFPRMLCLVLKNLGLGHLATVEDWKY